jgi:hypothetical protein
MAHAFMKTQPLQLDSLGPSSIQKTTQQQQQQQASLDEQLCRRLGLLLDCFSIAFQLRFRCCSNSLDEQLDGRLGLLSDCVTIAARSLFNCCSMAVLTHLMSSLTGGLGLGSSGSAWHHSSSCPLLPHVNSSVSFA